MLSLSPPLTYAQEDVQSPVGDNNAFAQELQNFRTFLVHDPSLTKIFDRLNVVRKYTV
jgi:hypothetical protein